MKRMDHKKIETTKAVYNAIYSTHKGKLKCFESYSASGGDYLGGNMSVGKMYTGWGFENSDVPILAIESEWEIKGVDWQERMKRYNEKHTYWLCIGIED